jgi:hypothetical protein
MAARVERPVTMKIRIRRRRLPGLTGRQPAPFPKAGSRRTVVRASVRGAAIGLLGGLALAVGGAGYANVVILSVGTQMNVHLTDSLSSTSASPGQTVGIVAAGPLVAQGNVAVVSGAIGQGHVVSVTPPKKGKSAAIALQFDWITAIDGQHVPIAATKKGDPLIIGAGGPYAKQFPAGKPVEIGSDFVLPAYVSEERTVTINTGG